MEHAMHCTAKKEKGRPFSRQEFSFFPQKVKTSTERLPPDAPLHILRISQQSPK